jgi:hypothetical protein
MQNLDPKRFEATGGLAGPSLGAPQQEQRDEQSSEALAVIVF